MRNINKKLIRFLSMLLMGSVCFSVISCKGNSENSSENSTEAVKEYKSNPVFSDSNYSLVENGQTEYVVVYPEASTTYESLGVKELVLFFEQATGIRLQTKKDTEYFSSDDAKMISVGQTILWEDQGIDLAEYELGSSGYVIKTIDDDVYLVGDGKYGSLYAVYEFLSYEFEWDVFAKDEIYIEENVMNKKLKAFDLKDVPDLDLRLVGNSESGDLLNRFRLNPYSDIYAGNFGANDISPFHNYLKIINPAKYGEQHAEWFSPDGSTLCLTRDFDGLLEATTTEVIQMLRDYPSGNIVTFTQPDGGPLCTHCVQEYMAGEVGEGYTEMEYHTMCAIKFVNELAKKIKVWNEAECPERDIGVYMFSYTPTNQPPVKEDANGNPILDAEGNYTVFDETLEISDNFGVVFTYGWYVTYNSTMSENYAKVADSISRWRTMTSQYVFWGYTHHYQNYFVPFDGVQNLQAYIQFARENNGRVGYILSHHDSATTWDWGDLESYLNSKLMWNADANVPELVDKFFKHYFKDAAPVMKELYSDYKAQLAWITNVNQVHQTANGPTDLLTVENYPYGRLTSFLDKIDQAYVAISQLENTDPELYKKLHDRINKESVTFRYMLYKLYPSYYPYDQLQELRANLIAECLELGVNLSAEGKGIESLF